MGNCFFKDESCYGIPTDARPGISKHSFKIHHAVGKGGFGKVWRVSHIKSKKGLAMKEMQKQRIISKRSVQSVLNERKLLAILKHPFIVNMHYAFQDKDNLYLVLDLLSGGDLRYHICKHSRFSEQQTRFFVICLLLALEYLHLNGIIHRDIKPENLVLDRRGYLRVTDFGVSQLWQAENSSETSGTPGYMAPEVICRMNHTVAADYFAVGVIVYELMIGRRPYLGKTRKDIRDAIICKQVRIRNSDIPNGWTNTAADFANKCLQRKASKRLGFRGPHEIKSHPWFHDIDWNTYLNKEIQAPFVPAGKDNFDPRQVMSGWDHSDTSPVDTGNANLFAGYYYDVGARAESEGDTSLHSSNLSKVIH